MGSFDSCLEVGKLGGAGEGHLVTQPNGSTTKPERSRVQQFGSTFFGSFWINSLVQLWKLRNATNFDAILDSKPRSYEGYDQAAIADGHDEQVFYEDGNYQEDYDGLNEHEQNEALEHGVEYVPNGYIPNGYVPNGYVPNGHVANGPLLQYQPQGIQSEGQARQSNNTANPQTQRFAIGEYRGLAVVFFSLFFR